mmetsp:Transcript_7947/g.49062  ORF Transcript_7947/g.49062 Transcript_7947/m.49062 type:complete len:142 (-) Transcript_7947:822-1247(-)
MVFLLQRMDGYSFYLNSEKMQLPPYAAGLLGIPSGLFTSKHCDEGFAANSFTTIFSMFVSGRDFHPEYLKKGPCRVGNHKVSPAFYLFGKCEVHGTSTTSAAMPIDSQTCELGRNEIQASSCHQISCNADFEKEKVMFSSY